MNEAKEACTPNDRDVGDQPLVLAPLPEQMVDPDESDRAFGIFLAGWCFGIGTVVIAILLATGGCGCTNVGCDSVPVTTDY